MSDEQRVQEEIKNLGRKVVEIDAMTYYVAEGDLLLDEDQVAEYARMRVELERARQVHSGMRGLGTATVFEDRSTALVGITENGKLVRWEPGMALTYCVLKQTFTSDKRYAMARDAMARATSDWERTCGVLFRHRPELDDSPGLSVTGAVFTVREFDSGGRFIAAAFFPNDPPSRRRVLIDPSFFAADLTFDPVGVLRHELGHVLGFRHEHIRSEAPPVCPDEPLFDTENLTAYDPQSVMHYFCGQVGTRELRITAVDQKGSQMLYGPPLNAVTFMA